MNTCPSCRYRTDAAMGIDTTGAPTPGDVSICLNCAAVNVFTAYGLATADADTVADVMSNPAALLAIRYIRAKGLHSHDG